MANISPEQTVYDALNPNSQIYFANTLRQLHTKTLQIIELHKQLYDLLTQNRNLHILG